MRAMFKAGMIVLALVAMPVLAQAGEIEGIAIGAGSGAIVAGPVGAVVGGVVGAVVGGPNIVHPTRHCWFNRGRLSSLLLALSLQIVCVALRSGAASRRSGKTKAVTWW